MSGVIFSSCKKPDDCWYEIFLASELSIFNKLAIDAKVFGR